MQNTSVTIVMVGQNTWKRRYVDGKIAASLRNTAIANECQPKDQQTQNGAGNRPLGPSDKTIANILQPKQAQHCEGHERKALYQVAPGVSRENHTLLRGRSSTDSWKTSGRA